jgi:hypothetical protein
VLGDVDCNKKSTNLIMNINTVINDVIYDVDPSEWPCLTVNTAFFAQYFFIRTLGIIVHCLIPPLQQQIMYLLHHTLDKAIELQGFCFTFQFAVGTKSKFPQ